MRRIHPFSVLYGVIVALVLVAILLLAAQGLVST